MKTDKGKLRSGSFDGSRKTLGLLAAVEGDHSTEGALRLPGNMERGRGRGGHLGDGGQLAPPQQLASPVEADQPGGGEGDGAVGHQGHHLVLPVLRLAEQGEDAARRECMVGLWKKSEEIVLACSLNINSGCLSGACRDRGTSQGEGEGGQGGRGLVQVEHPCPASKSWCCV